MLNRQHIEHFLKLNGLTPEASDDHIRTLLISARWNPEDIDSALIVLRENPNAKSKQVNSMQQFFNSDEKLNPETLSSLLGMDVEVKNIVGEHKTELESHYRYQIVTIMFVSVLAALIFLFAVMWFMKVGIFHEFALEF